MRMPQICCLNTYHLPARGLDPQDCIWLPKSILEPSWNISMQKDKGLVRGSTAVPIKTFSEEFQELSLPLPFPHGDSTIVSGNCIWHLAMLCSLTGWAHVDGARDTIDASHSSDTHRHTAWEIHCDTLLGWGTIELWNVLAIEYVFPVSFSLLIPTSLFTVSWTHLQENHRRHLQNHPLEPER